MDAFLFRFSLFTNKYTVAEMNRNGILMCLCFSAMPLIPLLHPHAHTSSFNLFYLIILVTSFFFGFLQYCFSPTLSQEMKKYYTNDDDELLFSCWDGGKRLGRILGFVFMEIEMVNLLFSWNVSMLILIGIMALDILLIFYYLDIR